MPKLVSMDKFLQNTLRAFLEQQHDLYLEQMESDAPSANVEMAEINKVQATYEVAVLAAATIARFVCKVTERDMIPRNSSLLSAAETFERAICEEGDRQLVGKGIAPPT